MSVLTEVKLPQVGDKVIGKFVPNITGNPIYDEIGGVVITGQLVTVTKVEHSKRSERIPDTDKSRPDFVYGPMIWAEFYRGPEREATKYYFTEWEYPAEETTENQEIANLKSELAQSRAHISKLVNDFDGLCDIIINEAGNAGYCNEYDKVVSAVNEIAERSNCIWRLKLREHDFEIEVRVSGEVRAYTTVTVSATSFEEAADFLADSPEDYVDVDDILRKEIDSQGWDETDVQIN